MSSEEIARLIALAEAATPGPWAAFHHEGYGWTIHCDERSNLVSGDWRETDGDFIAAANPSTVVALCQALLRARQELACARALLGEALPWVEAARDESPTEQHMYDADNVVGHIRAELDASKADASTPPAGREPYNPRVHGACSCGGSRSAYRSCEVHGGEEEGGHGG
jgi:hypothetical protein